MIDFSLTYIQEHAPYPITLTDAGFIFHTDFGLIYRVSLDKEDIVLGGCDTYQLILQNVGNGHAPKDPKVETTVLAIIEEFFRSNQEILLYLCDTSDHREMARSRLFMLWFKRNADATRFTILSANTIVEDQFIYAAIIVENNNPHLSDITADFQEMANALTNKPN